MSSHNFEIVQGSKGSLQHIDPAAAAAAEAAKARIQSAYVMALQKPRNADDARDRILKACRRPAFAERVEFSKPVGGKQIKGPSIRFAELALREWQNVISDVQILYEDEHVRRSRIMIMDLETNASFSKEIQAGKTVERKSAFDREVVSERTNTKGEKVFVVKCTEDELHNKEAALISKAIRNEGLRLIPSDIIDEALETARSTLQKRDAEDPQAAKKRILDAFSEIGIGPRDLEKYLKHKTDMITPAEIQELRTIYRAIRDREATWADYIQPSPVEEKTLSRAEALKEKLKATKKEEPAEEDVPEFSLPEAEKKAPGGGLFECPETGKLITRGKCRECPKRQGCSAWK